MTYQMNGRFHFQTIAKEHIVRHEQGQGMGRQGRVEVDKEDGAGRGMPIILSTLKTSLILKYTK